MDAKTILKVILIILGWGAIGGGIAYIGNQLGRYIGRKKMSIFKLRPRHTSTLFTVMTGMMIASLTLGLAMIFSEPVRIAIIDPGEIQRRRAEYEKLVGDINDLKQKDLVYKKQDVIVSAVVKADPDAAKMEKALKEIVAASNQAALNKSAQVAKEGNQAFDSPMGGRLVGYIPENLTSVAKELSRVQGEYVIFARANQNAILGKVFFVELGNPLPNELVFHKGELLDKVPIDGRQKANVIFDQLVGAVKGNITQQALVKGLFPNPEDGTVGECDSKQLWELTDRIKRQDRTVKVGFYATEDTFMRGPLKLEPRILSGE